MQQQSILTVTQLTQAVKNLLEQNFRFVCLQGEISNFKKQSSGHLYFSLKDSQSQISAAMFRGYAQNIMRLPKDGDKVIIKGEITVYPPRGNYQIIVHEVVFTGTGELLLKLEQLKKKLNSMGWFNPEHKKPIPKMPRKIGVVTSPTGAAIQDILNILNRRFSGFHLILNPVRVQGVEAPAEIAQAIQEFNKYNLVDVIIVGRGGGSIEDLWAFNEEIVAKAIFESTIPIISAVGHETDHSIADYVADIRAPTPSAAAQIVIAEKAHQEQTLSQLQQRIHQIITHQITQYRQRLKLIMKQPWYISPYNILGTYVQKIDDLNSKIHNTITQNLTQKKIRLQGVEKTIKAINPKNLLKKGYSIVFKGDKAIKSVEELSLQDTINVLLLNGEIQAKVEKL